jgi:hypothetical protein
MPESTLYSVRDHEFGIQAHSPPWRNITLIWGTRSGCLTLHAVSSKFNILDNFNRILFKHRFEAYAFYKKICVSVTVHCCHCQDICYFIEHLYVCFWLRGPSMQLDLHIKKSWVKSIWVADLRELLIKHLGKYKSRKCKSNFNYVKNTAPFCFLWN